MRSTPLARHIWDMTIPWLPLYWNTAILSRYHRAGYTFVSLTLQDWPPTMDGMSQCIDRFRKKVRSESKWLVFAGSMPEIDSAAREGKLAIGLNSQETILIGHDTAQIERLHGFGVRHMLLAYNTRNFVADGCAERSDAGLSNFGRRVIREMNRAGIVVDGSHTGHRSSLEAIELSELPTIFSHSGVYSQCPHHRNLRDDQIRLCAEGGGVIGVVGVGAYLGDREARTQTVFAQIDSIASLAGPEHVGLGSDYVDIFPVRDHADEWAAARSVEDVRPWPDARDAWPDEDRAGIRVEDSHCFAPEQLAELVELLQARGYSAAAIEGILGGNFRRVYTAAEARRRQCLPAMPP